MRFVFPLLLVFCLCFLFVKGWFSFFSFIGFYSNHHQGDALADLDVVNGGSDARVERENRVGDDDDDEELLAAIEGGIEDLRRYFKTHTTIRLDEETLEKGLKMLEENGESQEYIDSLRNKAKAYKERMGRKSERREQVKQRSEERRKRSEERESKRRARDEL